MITSFGKSLIDSLTLSKIPHGPIKTFGGGCSTTWYVTELRNASELAFLALTVNNIRKLMPNEYYYMMYEDEDRSLPDWDDLYEDEEPWSYYNEQDS